MRLDIPRRRHLLARLAFLALSAMLASSLVCMGAPTPALGKELTEDELKDPRPQIVVDPFANAQGDGVSAVLYNNPNGLPTSEANAIAQTSEGFIWIGSYAGLVRYDGNHFERIDSTTGVASVVSLYTDSQDRLWIGTNDSGIAVMAKGELHFFSKDAGLGSASVRAIAEDAVGNIYAATTKGVAVITPDMTLRLLDDSRLRGAYINSLRAGAGGLIYGLTRDGSVFILDEGRMIAYHPAEDIGVNDIIAILPDLENPGLAYFGTKQSEIYHGSLSDLREAEKYDISPLNYVKSIEKYDDQLWVTADNGIGAIEDGKVRQLTGVPLDNSIDHSMVDYEGNLWFTSSRQGVMKMVRNRFLDLYERYGLEPAVANTTCRHHGLLLVGTDDGLTVLDDNGKAAPIPLESVQTASGVGIDATDLAQMLNGVRIRSIVHDDSDNLWIATYGTYGLIRYDGKTATCFTVEDGMPSDRTRIAVQLSDCRMFVACTGGAVIIRDNKVERVYGEKDGIDNPEVLTVAEAPGDVLLVGTDGGGLYCVGERGITHMNVGDGLASDVILRLKRDDANGVTWIITSNSIAYMDSLYRITTVRNFPYPNNFDLFENGQGEIWVLASNGIYVTSAAELLANGKVSTVCYDHDNGLSCIATANSYSELDDDGNLYIAGSTGVVRVNIKVPFDDVTEIKMAVPFIEADGRFVYPNKSGTLVVPASTTRLTVYPFVYTYSLMNPQVAYSLKGFDQSSTTVRASELAPLTYTNLGGGTYTFTMQLHDAMGHGNKTQRITIFKQLALRERPWFRFVVFACGVLVVLLVSRAWARFRTKRLLQKQEEDRQYIREMSEAFARVIDMKDAYTSGHSSRVAYYTKLLTRELGYDDDTVERYYNIALLHDIGKIGVRTDVLNKPGRLTDEEFETIKSHATLGHDALKDISIMPEIAVGAWAHHERPDGKGYPQGLKEGEIPRVAQIIAVADTFDAMYSDRPYRKRMNFEKAVSIIREVRGTQLTKDVVDAFLRLVERGKFRSPSDTGGGTMEDIDNIHKRLSSE
ncbi:MAG: HD domain-containing protein [Atopobiaceae bacterium]|nr:HD domain-containing protein [Atopobiaceae bacterium]